MDSTEEDGEKCMPTNKDIVGLSTSASLSLSSSSSSEAAEEDKPIVAPIPTPETILLTQRPLPQHARNRSVSAGNKTTISDITDDPRLYDSKVQSPLLKPANANHRRKVSWGTGLLQIPEARAGESIPPLFPERPKDRDVNEDNNDDVGGDDDESDKASRAKIASDIVSEIEATMQKEGMDMQTIISSKYQNRPNDGSSAFAVDIDDLAQMHPLESKATLGVIKAIESKDHEHQGDVLRERGQSEAVANLFAPADTRLLDNVPEGAEELFQRDQMTTNVSSTAGDSTITYTSESMVGTSIPLDEALPMTTNRVRLDSATQYSIDSTLGETTSNNGIGNVGRNRSNTVTSFQSVASIGKSPHQRRRHRRDETMEERLLSLNQALEAADATISSEFSISQHQDGEVNANQEEGDTNHHRRLSTSLDLFNQNLFRLFQDTHDGQPGSETGGSDETEMTPLAKNDLGAHNDPIVTNETVGGANMKEHTKRNSISEDALLDDLSTLEESKIATERHQHQQGFQSKADEDVEVGIFRPTGATVPIKSSKSHTTKCSRFCRSIIDLESVRNMKDFFKIRIPFMLRYLKNLFVLIAVAIFASAIMFYAFENPPTVHRDEFEPSSQNQTCRYVLDNEAKIDSNGDTGASYSWWTLYLLARLPITFTIARFLEIFFIHFIILECRWLGSCIGPTFTLLIVQAQGWPAILFFWSICNLCMLYGTSPFVNHWGYWQDYIELFNECNSSGTIISSNTNLKVQLIALVISLVVALKRLLIGFYQGRKTFLNYSEELSRLMTKILLISEISNLPLYLEIEDQDDDAPDDTAISDGHKRMDHPYRGKRSSITGIDTVTQVLKRSIDDEEGFSADGSQADSSLKTGSTDKTNATTNKLLVTDKQKKLVTGLLSQAQKRRIERLLGSWREPEREKILTENVSIGAILQFRKSLSRLDSEFPFSHAFGKADTRNDCIQSAQNLYFRLLEKSTDEEFHFNVLGLTALQADGSLDQEKLKTLIKVFRPNRDGLLSLLDFVKSTDVVYKEMKLLRASVRNSQKIDKSFEKIFNVLFYFAIACVILNVLGYDPIAVFLSLSSVVLAFSFMISQASSKYIEGLLFILYRRPYDIGDMVVIQPVDQPTSWNGSTQWVVQDVDLFTTTVVCSYTNEIATLSNGSIANSRVMNGARSLPAIVYVTLRFGVDTGFDKFEIFREALSQYVDRRPREWSKLYPMISSNVQADQGFVEYLVCLQHVNNWQQLDSINLSRSQAKFFCHELSKKLDMRYKSPALPVDLSIDRPLADLEKVQGNLNNNVTPASSRLSAESDQIRNLIRDRRM